MSGYSGNYEADAVERRYETEARRNEEATMGGFYDCPVCGVEIEVGPRETEVSCPSCHAELELDPDADYHEGAWHDESRLITR